jgi:peptidoglycan/xylan/chitin deacetylase (PgdA/CDA1 family)
MRQGVPVFTYHKIAEPPPATRDPFLYVSPVRFDEQLAGLRRAGCVSACLGEAFREPGQRSSKRSPEATALAKVGPAAGGQPQAVVLTFDDGCRNVLEHGLDILARHRFSAIQFLVAGFLGKRNEWDIVKGDVAEALMDEGQIREWLNAGHEIGSHSMTHRNLRHLSPADAREEIFGSKKSLEDRFGVPVQHFCYPYGSWNEEVRDLVREAGYFTACTVCFGVNIRSTPPYELRRIIPLSTAELLRKMRHRLARRMGGGR